MRLCLVEIGVFLSSDLLCVCVCVCVCAESELTFKFGGGALLGAAVSNNMIR